MPKFHRVPCETCKEDTLHAGLRCVRCGEIFITPTEHRREARMRMVRRAVRSKGDFAGRVYVSSLYKKANEAARKEAEEKGTRTIDTPAMRGGGPIPKRQAGK
jgi:ribosomal protein S27E